MIVAAKAKSEFSGESEKNPYPNKQTTRLYDIVIAMNIKSRKRPKLGQNTILYLQKAKPQEMLQTTKNNSMEMQIDKLIVHIYGSSTLTTGTVETYYVNDIPMITNPNKQQDLSIIVKTSDNSTNTKHPRNSQNAFVQIFESTNDIYFGSRDSWKNDMELQDTERFVEFKKNQVQIAQIFKQLNEILAILENQSEYLENIQVENYGLQYQKMKAIFLEIFGLDIKQQAHSLNYNLDEKIQEYTKKIRDLKQEAIKSKQAGEVDKALRLLKQAKHYESFVEQQQSYKQQLQQQNQ
ncbi:UNKNOWN [Stylonychia lemnae]|uniref:Uncharacterized protein n=1 Tax=Stylonychia lemnae TaxID=5949 RepID=A0A078ARW1_STYLE|nr:UNKNOWN [Stylonychia lemnae]|eukprot:CDW83927.1 UNKNOWN [Stylonychia lemnae]